MFWWVLKRRVHVSWLIAIACGGIVVGVFCARFARIDLVWALPLLILFLAAFKSGRVYVLPLVLIVGFILGLARGSSMQAELDNYKPLCGENITASGVVADDADIDSSGKVKLRLSDVSINGEKFPGIIWVSTTDLQVQRGDMLIIGGKLSRGFGNFAGAVYNANISKIIHPNPPDLALSIRNWFASAIKRVLPEPESSLGIGFLVGQRRSLSADFVTALQVVGLTHIVVASGYNLTILVRLARRLFEKVSKYLSALSAIIMIFAFLSITGISPSMSRAALVSLLSLGAWYYGRKFHPIILLLVAMSVTVIINPSYIWGDIGWQLSFAAFAGVMILAPLLQKYFLGNDKPKLLARTLFETVSAQVVTAPIIISSFGLFSNVAIIANLLVLPLVPLGMLLTFVAGLGSIMLPGFSTVIVLPAHILLGYMINVINFFSRLSWAATEVRLSGFGMIICYFVIIAICVVLWRATKYNLRDVNLVE
jgi:competence protein ComEC